MSNLRVADRLIAAAAAAGARLAALPENFYLIGRHEADKVKLREPEGEGPIPELSRRRRAAPPRLDSRGTAPISCADPGRIRSACLVFDDSGRRVARYDKMQSVPFRGGRPSATTSSRTLEAGESASRCRALRASRAVGLLRCALSRVVSRARRFRTPCSFPRLHRAHRRRSRETLLRAAPSRTRRTSLRRAQGGLHPSGRRNLRAQHDCRPMGPGPGGAPRRRRGAGSPKSTPTGCARCAHRSRRCEQEAKLILEAAHVDDASSSSRSALE